MKSSRLLLAIFFVICSYPANASESYLCITEEKTGFSYSKGRWETVKFEVSDDKLILRVFKDSDLTTWFGEGYTHGVFPLGSKAPMYACVTNIDKRYICRVGFGSFFFSPDSGRFIKTYPFGYVDGKDSQSDNPTISRGRCSVI
jgi:hypothetical protein